MKKALKIVVCCFVISCVAIVGYISGEKSMQDDIVFELSRSNEHSYAEYYALKKDNTLVWVIGYGRMNNGTFGSYFAWVDEAGYVSISEEDAQELTRSVKKTVKNFKSVPSNLSVNKNDGLEELIKYNNKYYNQDYPNKDIDVDNKNFSVRMMKKKVKEYVDEYRTKGANISYY